MTQESFTSEQISSDQASASISNISASEVITPGSLASEDSADHLSMDGNTPRGQTSESANYTKLAMRNMVRKKGTSLKHFFLTLVGLLAFLIGLSYLTH